MNIDLNKFTKEELLSMINDGLDHAKEQRLELESLHSIIKEARKCINHYAIEDEDFSKIYNQEEQELLEILDKVEENK